MSHGANKQNAFQLALLLLPSFVNQAELAYPEPKSGPLKNVYVRTALSSVLQMIGAAAALNNPAFADTIATIINSTVAYNNAARESTTETTPVAAPIPVVAGPVAVPDNVTENPAGTGDAFMKSFISPASSPAIVPAVTNVMTPKPDGS